MRKKRTFGALALGVAAFVATPVVSSAQSTESEDTATYVVVLDDSSQVSTLANTHGGEVKGTYEHALNGYSADMTASEAADLEGTPGVRSVTKDVMLHLYADDVPTGVQRIFGPDNPNLGIGGPEDKRVDVDIAVIDTGIADHTDLDVVSRMDCSSGSCTEGGVDDHGHGTHVSGTAAGINDGSGVVGVAPGARLHAFKVCDASGQCPSSAIVAAVDAVTAQADTIEVANMSLGGPGSIPGLDAALSASVDAGVVHVVAAGNDSSDASGFTPANHPDVVTVSALSDSDGAAGGSGGAPSCRPEEQDDTLAVFSNFGDTVEIAAPGVCILSSWNDGAYSTISGTSMASPHGAGAAAILASGTNDPTNREQVEAVRQKLIDTGNADWNDTSGDGVQEPLLDIHDGAEFPPGGGN